ATRVCAILTCLAVSAAFGSTAEAKRGKKSSAPVPATEVPPTEESGSIAPGSVPEKSGEASAPAAASASTSTAQADPSAPAGPPPAAQESEKSEKAQKADDEAAKDQKPIKMDAATPPEVVPPTPSQAPLRKASGNADSPEGVTWKASGWDVTLYGYVGLNIMQ